MVVRGSKLHPAIHRVGSTIICRYPEIQDHDNVIISILNIIEIPLIFIVAS